MDNNMDRGSTQDANNSLVSVIIPVYNVERFLSDCLASVSRQTYKNIDIILVDDGSTDCSGKTCDEYAKAENRAVVIHQENMGLSGARNTGINHAKGNYITFIDSDDMIAENFIEILYESLIQSGSDIAVSDYCRISEDEHSDDSHCYNARGTSSIIFNNADAIKAVYGKEHHGMQYIVCGKLYLKDLFITNDVRFPVGKIHEDTFITYKVLYSAEKICYIDEPLYLYRVRKGSIMNSGFSKKSLVKFEAIQEECNFFWNHDEPKLYSLAFFNLLFEKKNTIREMVNDKKIGRKEIRQFAASIREDIKGYEGKRAMPLKKRLFYTILSYFPTLAKELRLK